MDGRLGDTGQSTVRQWAKPLSTHTQRAGRLCHRADREEKPSCCHGSASGEARA